MTDSSRSTKTAHDSATRKFAAQPGSTPLVLDSPHSGTVYPDDFGSALPLAVLVNPAAVDRINLQKFEGEHANFHTGERFIFTPEHSAQLRAQLAPPTPTRYWLLTEEGDEVLDWRDARDYYAGCRQTILHGGDHSFTQFPHFIPQILEFAGL